MGFNDISNTGLRIGLGLSLGLYDHQHHRQREISKGKKEDDSSKYCNKAYPSLTLGPIDHSDEANNHQPVSKIEASSRSTAVSSFSNSSSIKRERDHFLGEEFEAEVEKVPSKVQDDVDEDGYPRKKLRLTKEQSAVLEENFKEHSTLNPKQKQELARKLKMRARQVEVWFQNRRARTKLKQTESDCEVLKKYCETLTEENKRLQKELQELKSMQTTAAPFRMQIPAATTLTICPSCERICSGSSGNNNSSAPHHFYTNNYPFSNSSYPQHAS